MRSRFFLTVGIVAVIVVIAVLATMEYTSRPKFCNSCHEMNPMYSAWNTSAHKNVTCLKCHANPGTLGYFAAKFGALRDVYYHISGTYARPIKAIGGKTEFNKRCLTCHKNQVGKNQPHNKTHFDNGLACLDCHKGLVHDKKTNTKPPTDEVCKQCHE